MNCSTFYPASSFKEFNIELNTYNEIEKIFHVSNIPPIAASKYDEFMRLVKDTSCEVLLAWRGGRVDNNDTHKSSIELVNSLQELDFQLISQSDKKIVGSSDITYLHCALLNKNIKCYYGPNYRSSFAESDHEKRQIMHKYLCLALSEKEFEIDFSSDELSPNNKPWVFSPGKCSGRLSGGNLDTLYEYSQKVGISNIGVYPGDILFIEENDPSYSITKNGIDGSMYQKLLYFKKHGLLDNINGLIIGRSNITKVFDPINALVNDEVQNSCERKYLKNVVTALDLKDIPILANIACGHKLPTVTLPLGKLVTLNTDTLTLTI